jgi:hypothetical protein
MELHHDQRKGRRVGPNPMIGDGCRLCHRGNDGKRRQAMRREKGEPLRRFES